MELTKTFALFAALALAPLAQAQELTSGDRAALRQITDRALERYEVDAQQNPNARENAEHIRRLIQSIEADAPRLRQMGVEVEVLRTAIAMSDLGKNDTARNAMVRAVFPLEPPQMAHFRAFLLHEVPGLVWFNAQARELGLSRTAIRDVTRALRGHNGPAVEGTFWRTAWDANIRNYEGPRPTGNPLAEFAARYLGRPYPEPGSLAGAIHTALDRRDQGTRDGSLKIMGERMNRGESLERAFNESFRLNQEATLRQFDRLSERYPQILELPSVREAREAVERTSAYANHVRFSEGGTRAEIRLPNGTTVTATEIGQFSEALRQIPLEQTQDRPQFESASRRAVARMNLPQLRVAARQAGVDATGMSRAQLVAALTGQSQAGADRSVQAARRGSVQALQELTETRNRRGARR